MAIPLPAGVRVSFVPQKGTGESGQQGMAKSEQSATGDYLSIKGAKGEVAFPWTDSRFTYKIEEQKFNALESESDLKSGPQGKQELLILRADDQRSTMAMHGTIRATLANCITGVSTGFERNLQLVGVGYRVQKTGTDLSLSLGYSNKVTVSIPRNIQVEVSDQTKLKLSSIAKHDLGTFVSQLKRLRKVDPYKGKGLLEDGVPIRRKAGKSGKVAQK